ncbi:hypothetical protein [Luteimonas sp. A649]
MKENSVVKLLENLVAAIPEAARTPLGLVAFVALLATILTLGLRTRRLAILSRSLRDLPESDRRRTLEIEMNQPLPADISAKQWITHQVHKFVLIGFLALVLLGAFLAILTTSPDKEIVELPDPEAVASRTLSTFYGRGDDSHIYDMWLEVYRSQYGSLKAFRKAADQVRTQLVEAPVQRKRVSVDVTPSAALVIFDAETESGMVWRERVELHAIEGAWRLSGFNIAPRDWSEINLSYAEGTLDLFSISSAGSTAVIPPAGWKVQTVAPPTASDASTTTCDVEVVSNQTHATMNDVYGVCGVTPGANLLVLGVAERTDGAISLSKIRFFPI